MKAKFKLITATDISRFEERLNAFISELSEDDILVDVKFSTTIESRTTEYSALIHYQETEAWAD